MATAFNLQGATPQQGMGSASTFSGNGNTPAARALNGAQMTPPPIPLIPPSNTGTPALKSHSIQHPDGTVITQSFHAPKEEGLLGKKPETKSATESVTPLESTHQIHVINGMHHVPFRTADGSIKHINAKGEII